MDDDVLIERLACHTDPRGLVLEPVGPDDLPSQRNAHIVLTNPGAIRGNHYHERGDEITVVIGPALARYVVNGETRDFLVPDGESYRFRIPRGIPHAFQNTGDRPIILIGFNTEAHDPGRPDVVRFPLIEL